MAHEAKKPTGEPLTLPVMVASTVDVGRLVRELESLDEALLQQGLRANKGNTTHPPAISHLMEQTLHLNKLDLLKSADRQSLQQFLGKIKDHAPALHMSFSADPPPAFTEKLMTWLRREIHPQLLLTIGLQPTIGAGCIVRTTNKQFDFSLRQDFLNQRELLLSLVAAVTTKPESAP